VTNPTLTARRDESILVQPCNRAQASRRDYYLSLQWHYYHKSVASQSVALQRNALIYADFLFVVNCAYLRQVMFFNFDGALQFNTDVDTFR